MYSLFRRLFGQSSRGKMRITDTFSKLGKKLYDVGGNVAQGTAVAAAGASLLTGIRYAQTGWNKVKDYIPAEAHEALGRHVSHALSAPLAILGLADGIAAIYKVKSLGRHANIFDYTSIPFRLFPVAAPVISYATHGNILATVGTSLGISAIGQLSKYVGNLKRKGSESYSKPKMAKIAEGISIGAGLATLITGISYAAKGWTRVIEKYTPHELHKSVGNEISTGVSIPLAMMGLADGIHAMYEIKEKSKRTVTDYLAVLFRMAPAAIAPVVAITTGNPVYTIGSSLATSTIGHGLTFLSAIKDKRSDRK